MKSLRSGGRTIKPLRQAAYQRRPARQRKAAFRRRARHWYFSVISCAARSVRTARSCSDSKTRAAAAANSDGVSASNRCCRGSASMPSAPFVVETTGVRRAIDSRIFSRVPPPSARARSHRSTRRSEVECHRHSRSSSGSLSSATGRSWWSPVTITLKSGRLAASVG